MIIRRWIRWTVQMTPWLRYWRHHMFSKTCVAEISQMWFSVRVWMCLFTLNRSKNSVLLPNYSFWFSGSFTAMATPALGIYITHFILLRTSIDFFVAVCWLMSNVFFCPMKVHAYTTHVPYLSYITCNCHVNSGKPHTVNAIVVVQKNILLSHFFIKSGF